MNVVIVGGGASGVLTAVHLMRSAAASGLPRLHLTLIDRTDTFGRGIAYAKGPLSLLLNVRAALMSALPDDPEHFVRWLDRRGLPNLANEFVPRTLYGDYLESILADARRDHARVVTSELVADEVVEIIERRQGVELTLRSGRRCEADAVVLALGHRAPRELAVDGAAPVSALVIQNPWRRLAGTAPRATGTVAIIGSGLTSVDHIVDAQARGFRGEFVVISRHGLAPRAHTPAGSAAQARRPSVAPHWHPIDAAASPALREVVAQLRTQIASGTDWRAAIDALRSATPRLWGGLRDDERRRFLRHLRVYWDAHRHRVAPQIAARLIALQAAHRLRIIAGRVTRLAVASEGVRVTWVPRGGGDPQSVDAAQVVNCTGPTPLAQSDDRLLRQALSSGALRSDAVSLGLDTEPNGAARRRDGSASDRVWTLGPPRQGTLWETTAMREIRVQAAEVAGEILARIAGQIRAHRNAEGSRRGKAVNRHDGEDRPFGSPG